MKNGLLTWLTYLALGWLAMPVAQAQFAAADSGLRALANGEFAVMITRDTQVWVYDLMPNLEDAPIIPRHWFQAQYVLSNGIDYLYDVPGLQRQFFIRKTLAMQPGEPMSGLMVYQRRLMPDIPTCNLQTGTFSLVPNGGVRPRDPLRPVFLEIGILQPAGHFPTREAAEIVLSQRQSTPTGIDSLPIRVQPGGPVTYKPIIYLYADTPTACYVRAVPATPFTALYPDVDTSGGWSVVTQPGGLLLHTPDRALYPSLFWEAPTAAAPTGPVSGWRWHRSELALQLELRLDSLGLKPRERAEFIQFWLPRLSAHEWVSVSFGWQLHLGESVAATAPGWEGYFAANGLEITPTPAQTLRLMMAWRPAPVPGLAVRNASPLPRLPRIGFYALEWGGFQWPDPATVDVYGK